MSRLSIKVYIGLKKLYLLTFYYVYGIIVGWGLFLNRYDCVRKRLKVFFRDCDIITIQVGEL